MSAGREETHDGVAAVAADPRDRGGPGTPLLSVRGLIKHFGRKAGLLTKAGPLVRAVDGVDFDVAKGETLGIVGESGCGKSTTARLIMQIITPDAGDILFDGEAVGSSALDLAAFREQVQMVFQDSYASLNPRLHGRGHRRIRPARSWRLATGGGRARARSAASGRARAVALRRALSA